MGVRILKGGMLTTVQDLGRTGYQSQGFSVSGVMDVRSFKIANLLLDNPENEAVLEFTLMGPTLEFTSETIISITGGDFRPQINGKPAKMYTAIYMHRGDILTFGGARTGTRGYIAFSSYLDIPVVMGSRSTNIKCKIGGFKGRKLEDEDYIGFRAKRRYLPYYLSRSLDLNEFDQEKVTLRVVMGPQEKMFTKEGRETFLNSEYTVTSEFDRMGCRLEGPFIAYKTTSDIISDGIAFGSVQVPSHGKPIILLADRQTTGGYAKIATVISVDIPKLVQRKTEQKVRFQAVSVEEAQKLLADEMKELNDFRSQIYTPCKEVLDCRLVAKRISALFEQKSRNTVNLEKIEKLVKIIENSSMLDFSIQEGDVKIKMSSRGSAGAPSTPMAVSTQGVDNAADGLDSDDEGYITSPIVGTFYSAPSPEAKAFVKVGDRVKAGQTVCILEAMKLMNEIESDFDCEIEAVLVSNEQKIEYGQPLFKVKKIED